LALVPINEGGGLKPTPFVTIHEKFIDGLIFRYAEYNNQAYIVVKDVATQLNLAHPKQRASDFKRRFKTILPNSFKKLRAMTLGGPQEINFATLEAINVFCSRSKNVEAAVDYITKLTQFQKWFYSTQSALVLKEEQTFLEDKLQGDYNFLSSEVKFLHENNSTLRRDVTLLAQAVKQLQTQLDTDIDRYQIKKIYDFIQTKLAVVIAEKKGLSKPTSTIYKDCWINFNNHFKIARYRDLPASKYNDALNYLEYLLEKISQELE
jgi:hypothetical protein